MRFRRRQILLGVTGLFLCSAAWGQLSPLDTVSVYLIPMDDFPEDLAEFLAKSLQGTLGFRVKASTRLPPLQVDMLAGTNQLAANSVLAQGTLASARLPETGPATYRLFLTLKDINSPSGNFRFLFSAHSKALNCSVVSLARMIEYPNQRPALTERSLLRLLKMTKRSIGEMYLGWNRSPDPKDVMFSPLMSVDELDTMSLEHDEQPAKDEQKTRTPKPSGNVVA